MRNIKNLRLILLIVIGVISLIWFFREPLGQLLAFASDRQAFINYIHRFGLLGPLVLALLQLIQVIVSVLPGDAFYFAAGYIYGLGFGYVINLTATILSGFLAFNIARRWGRPVVNRLASAAVIDRWDAAAKQHGFRFFLATYMLPVFPTDTMNYVAGLSSISWKQFLTASLLGRGPLIFLYTLLGAHSTDIAQLNLPPATFLLIILAVVGIYVVWLTFFRKMTTEVLKS